MPNAPDHAREKRPPTPKRHNAQGDHEGSSHDPEEFTKPDPQKRKNETDGTDT